MEQQAKLPMKKWTLLGTAFSVLILGICGLSATFIQGRLVVRNPADRRQAIAETPADYGLDYESIELTSDDGYLLAGWYVPSQNGAAVIAQHAYKGDRAGMLHVAEMLARHGYGVMLIDLRAHGESEGELISFGLYEVNDVEAAYQYLLTRPDVDPQRIGSLGASMGGVVVLLHAAQNEGIKAVAAESAFATLEDEIATGIEAATGLPAFPFAPLVRSLAEREAGFDADEVAPVAHVGAISPRALLLMQGGADTVIPPNSGQRLYDAAGEPRELWFEPDLGHAAFSTALAEEYEARVVTFFDRYLLLQE